jgi:hypothetical protein
LKNADAAAVTHAAGGAFREGINAAVSARAVVIPLIEISGVLPWRVEIEKECLSRSGTQKGKKQHAMKCDHGGRMHLLQESSHGVAKCEEISSHNT